MTKKTIFIVLVLTLSAFTLFASNIRSLKDEKDFAVPAFSDFFVLGGTKISIHQIADPMAPEEKSPLPNRDEMRQLDINHDLQLNDFDVKQFQNIVENLRGEKLRGIQLSSRFRIAQKNQKDSFPIFYDLDRDGMFTPYDVDYFMQVVSKLDKGRSHGTELIQNFKSQLRN